MNQLPTALGFSLLAHSVAQRAFAGARARAQVDAINRHTWTTIADTDRRLDRAERILALLDALDACDDDDND